MLLTRTFLPVVVLAMLTCTAASAAPSLVALAPQNAAWKEAVRLIDEAPHSDKNLEQGIAQVDAALKVEKDNKKRAVMHAFQAKAYLRLGDSTASKDKKRSIYDRGTKAAEAGIKADPKCADCHFWRTANFGRYVELRGIFKAAMSLGEIKDGFSKTLELEPGHPDALLSLAKIDEMLPSMLGGDMDGAEANTETSSSADRTSPGRWLSFVTFLRATGAKKKRAPTVSAPSTRRRPSTRATIAASTPPRRKRFSPTSSPPAFGRDANASG
jgi:hypothetical protein